MNFRSFVTAGFAIGIVASAGAAQAFPAGTLSSGMKADVGGAIIEKAEVVVKKTTVVRKPPVVVQRRGVVVQRRGVVVRRPALLGRPAVVVRP